MELVVLDQQRVEGLVLAVLGPGPGLQSGSLLDHLLEREVL